MKVSLSLEKSHNPDVAIMVDALRASTTMTVAVENFRKIIPVKTWQMQKNSESSTTQYLQVKEMGLQ